MMAMGVDGITVSPGYAYERAPDQQHFLNRERTKNMFREILARGNGGKNWDFTNSSLFMDFLAGNQTYECTPWSMPLLTVFGWQKPCYLLGEGYAKTFKELMEGTEWEKYGVGKYEKCANCMVHCGFEGTAATDAIKHPLKMLPILMRGVKTEGPMAPEIDLSKQRPAEFIFSRHVEQKMSEIQRRQVQHHRDRGSGVVPQTPCSTPAPCAPAPAPAAAFCNSEPSTRPSAMPPSGFIATRAAGGSTWLASSEITRRAASGRLRLARKAGGDLAFHVHRQRAGRVVQTGLGFGLLDDHIAAEDLALMGMRQARQQPHAPAFVAVPVFQRR